mmetsp:Transcript_46543/g.91903  ORF Transcript_46543/g.91903 Transcript_46543/m.91903 type:complete len:99 (+) Transcript_46543:914-1210(+)
MHSSVSSSHCLSRSLSDIIEFGGRETCNQFTDDPDGVREREGERERQEYKYSFRVESLCLSPSPLERKIEEPNRESVRPGKGRHHMLTAQTRGSFCLS